MLLDLREPPGQCSGCWPRDAEVDGCAVETFVLSESGWGDDGARAGGATDDKAAAAVALELGSRRRQHPCGQM